MKKHMKKDERNGLKVRNIINSIKAVMIGLMSSVSMSIYAFAEEKGKGKGAGENAVDGITGSKSNGAFSGINDVVKDFGASGYTLAMTVCAIALIVDLIVLGITLGFNAGNAQKTGEAKGHIVNIIIGSCIGFGALAFLGIIVSFAVAIAK